MDIRKLDIFVTVADLKSFSGAAKVLHMAQPAVSIAVRKLEESLNTCLLERDGRHIKLTAEGQTAYALAKDILAQAANLKESMSDMNTLTSGVLKIACPSMLATYHLPGLLSEFLSCYPGLNAEVSQAGTSRIEDMLVNNEIEVGVITADNPDTSLSTQALIDQEIVVCVAKEHPLAKLKQISPDQLAEFPMVLYEPDYYVRQSLDKICHQAGVKLNVRLQTSFLPLIIGSVKKQLGATVGINLMAEQEPGIVGIPLKPRAPFRMVIAWRTDRQLSRANKAFLEWLKENKTF